MVLPVTKLKKAPKGTRIAFVGKMGAGKTWCANYLQDHHNYTRFSLAGKLKALAYEMYGVQGKDGNDRLILQGLGTDLRKYDTDVWVKYLLNTIHVYDVSNKTYHNRVVVDDVRYLNEARLFRANGFTIIRVTTPSEVVSERLARLYPDARPEAAGHASETEQDQIQADYEIQSIGIETQTKLDDLLESF